MTPLERHNYRKRNGLPECVACGGSGVSSRGGECAACKATGAAIPQHSSSTNEHYTPAEIVEAARSVLGGIDLDPASCSLANETIKAAAFYGPGGLAPDGLVEPWMGRVFLNPPGGRAPEGSPTRSSAALWWATLAEAWRVGEVDAAIFVGFTLEILRSTQGLDVPQPIDFPFCVPSSRIAFDTLDEQGARVGSSSPTHANVIVFLPPRRNGHAPETLIDEAPQRFVEAFTPIGRCRV